MFYFVLLTKLFFAKDKTFKSLTVFLMAFAKLAHVLLTQHTCALIPNLAECLDSVLYFQKD